MPSKNIRNLLFAVWLFLACLIFCGASANNGYSAISDSTKHKTKKTEKKKDGKTKFDFTKIFKFFSNTAGANKDSNYKPPKVAWAFGPGAFYTPQTSLAFIIGGQLFFTELDKNQNSKLLDSKGKVSRRSNIGFGICGSIKSQFILQLNPEFYLPKYKLGITGLFIAEYWPTAFWGIGKNTPDSSASFYTPVNTVFSFDINYYIFETFSVGAGMSYNYLDIIKTDKGGLLDNKGIYGEGITQGLGITANLNHDSRNNNTSPSKGNFSVLKVLYNTSTFGYSEPFVSINLDVRQYVSIPTKNKDFRHTFAFNLRTNIMFGNKIPFHRMSSISKPGYAVGILNGRYIDKHMVNIQAEYRFYYKWIGIVGFLGTSGIGSTAKETINMNLLNYGVGIRLKPFKKLPFLIRLDFGFSKGGSNMYININENF